MCIEREHKKACITQAFLLLEAKSGLEPLYKVLQTSA